MSQEGWEVSFDGAANAFIMKQSADIPVADGVGASDVATFQSEGGIMSEGTDEVGIVTGLLPNVWGMTLKAPTANGLDTSARIGFYTHMQGTQDKLGAGLINLRETNFTVAGSFGSVTIVLVLMVMLLFMENPINYLHLVIGNIYQIISYLTIL